MTRRRPGSGRAPGRSRWAECTTTGPECGRRFVRISVTADGVSAPEELPVDAADDAADDAVARDTRVATQRGRGRQTAIDHECRGAEMCVRWALADPRARR